MDTIQRFEDLMAWQKARVLTGMIYRMTRSGGLRRDYDLRGQMRDAAVSTMSNIAEGYDRGAAGEFHHHLSIAKGSCAELRSELYVALDAEYISPEAFREAYARAAEVGRIIGGLRVSVQRCRTGLDGEKMTRTTPRCTPQRRYRPQ